MQGKIESKGGRIETKIRKLGKTQNSSLNLIIKGPLLAI